jgi:hypothetical protein
MKKTKERLAAETRISEWRELKKAVEAMEFEKFVNQYEYSIYTLQVAWYHYEELIKDQKEMNNFLFKYQCSAELFEFRRIFEREIPPVQEFDPKASIGSLDVSAWVSSAYQYSFFIKNNQYTIFEFHPKKRSELFEHKAYGIVKNENQKKWGNFEFFQQKNLPLFLQILGFDANIFVAYHFIENGENIFWSEAENLVNRLKIIATYLQNLVLSGELLNWQSDNDLMSFLSNLNPKIVRSSSYSQMFYELANKMDSYENAKDMIMNVRQTLTTLPIKAFEVF